MMIRVACSIVDKRNDMALNNELSVLFNRSIFSDEEERAADAFNSTFEKFKLDHLLIPQIDFIVFANNQDPR
jgi:hypothetical protein